MKTSEQISELAKALANAQAEIKVAIKDTTNPFFKSKYADLSEIVNASRGALTKNGLSITQGPDFLGDKWVLVSRLIHSSGQWIETYFPLLAKDQSPQAMGSAVTYAKRYAMSALVGVVTDDEDDDGELAQGRNLEQSKPEQRVKQTSAPIPAIQPKMAAPSAKEIKELGTKAIALGIKPEELPAFFTKNVGDKHSSQWNRDDFEKAQKAVDSLRQPDDFENFKE